MENIIFAFGLTLIAGLSTGIGSLIAFFAKKTNKKFLSVSLGFSAGVMIYVSMIEIFTKAQDALVAEMGERMGAVYTVIAFFGGMFLIALIDRLIPSAENPHEPKNVLADCEGCGDCEVCVKEKKAKEQKEKLMRLGVFTALAIGIHNFPEGMATFVSAFQDPSVAIPIVAAIAIHNIPEGIAVSVPIYQATGSRKRAFLYSFLSGLAEPMSDMVYGIIFAGVAGIMVFISIDELLPAAREYGEHHLSIYGVVAGMMVMAASLLLFM